MHQSTADWVASMPSPGPSRSGAGFSWPGKTVSHPSVRLAPNTGGTAGPSAPSGRLRVLVIEDVLDVAEQLEFALRSWGYDSRICATGSEGLALASYYRPHVVLIDIGLPDMNGWELARKLRSQAFAERATMIAVTAYSEEADFMKSARAGIDFHLVKPAFHAQLEQLLQRIRPWPEKRSTASSPEEIDKQVQFISFNARQLPSADRKAFVVAACRDLRDVGMDAEGVLEIERQVLANVCRDSD